MFVVLAATQAAAKQEKIKQTKFLSNKYFTDSDFAFKYSSVFVFDPFTPFPELLNNTIQQDQLHWKVGGTSGVNGCTCPFDGCLGQFFGQF